MITINHKGHGCCSTCEELKQAIRSQAELLADQKTISLTDKTNHKNFKTYWEIVQKGVSVTSETVTAGGTTSLDISELQTGLPLTIKQRVFDDKCDETIETTVLLCCDKAIFIGNFGTPSVAVRNCFEASKDSKGIVINLETLGINDATASITAVGTTANGGIVVLTETAHIVYVPTSGFVGVDSFEYTLTDGIGNTSTAMITVYVGIEIPDIEVEVSVGIENEIQLLPDGFTPPCECFKWVITKKPMYGNIIPDKDGVAIYTPHEGTTGKTDSFDYGFYCEGCELSFTATATVNIGEKVCPETEEEEEEEEEICSIDADGKLAFDEPVKGQITIGLKNLTGITGTPIFEIYISKDVPTGENAGDSFVGDITDSNLWVSNPIAATQEVSLPYTNGNQGNYFAMKVKDEKCEKVFYAFFDEGRNGTPDYESGFSKDDGKTWIPATL